MEIDADIIQPEDHDRRRSKNASLPYITLVILLISLMLLLCIHVICIYWTFARSSRYSWVGAEHHALMEPFKPQVIIVARNIIWKL